MFKIKGKYSEALVMLDSEDMMEQEAKDQVQNIVNHHTSKGTLVRIMCDTHTGYGVPIGFTQTLGKFVIPNLIGVDIGCGVSAYCLGDVDIDFEKFNNFISKIPHGFNVREKTSKYMYEELATDIMYICRKIGYDANKALRACGSLGGGNHFCEVDIDNDGNKWFIVHSGSRGFGHSYATYFQSKAKDFIQDIGLDPKEHKDLEFLPLDWVEEGGFYIENLKHVQRFAQLNREIILRRGVDAANMSSKGKSINFSVDNILESVHNYIDLDKGIIRKGAISAQQGERVIIPLNMRDGCIVGTGKGSKKWNYSAPHGAGRVMSRKKAKAVLDVSDFRSEMEGVWSSCVDESRLDEAPMAYKDKDVILEGIQETVDINFVMNPVYNFKA